MDRRYAGAIAVIVLGAAVVAVVALAPPSSTPADPLGPDRTYPPGAEADHIDFSALDEDNATVARTPRTHWDSYAIRYSAPRERRLVEGEYYIDSATGAIVGERWQNATVYIDGSTYAFVQPVDGLPAHQRRQFESDPQFVYHQPTNAYYRYDPRYGRVATTNLGRHTRLLDAYTWTAASTTTHHGVPVVTYRVTGTRPDADVPPARNGTLRLGREDGIVYAYDLTLDAGTETYRYTYTVEPAPFPDHEWVDRARDLATNASHNESDGDRRSTPR